MLRGNPAPLVGKMPPSDVLVQRFIGREAELLDLWTWLTDPDSRRWSLVGDGGKGKSALAYRGPSTDFSSLDEALGELLTFYDHKPELELTTKKKVDRCLGFLETLPHWLLLMTSTA